MRSEDCEGDTVPFAAARWYDSPEFEWHLGEGGQKWSPGNARFKRTGGDPILVADDNLHPSVKVYTPSADTTVSLDEPAVLKERTS